MEKMKIRLARQTDAAAILAIYAPYVLNTAVSFEYEVPTPQEFAGRMESSRPQYPYLVCEDGAEIIGYAYASRQRARKAYDWNADLSVYLREDQVGNGLGKRLYSALIGILRLQNVRNLYGGVTLPNDKSVGLHLSMGFERCAVYPKTGWKLGRWHDVAWYEKRIGGDGAPQDFVPFSGLDPAAVESILNRL